MAKSAIKAMDVAQFVSKRKGIDIQKFVVSGASKRGWTTWMTAASGDPRVVGIAPMVYNNLNLAAQMKHQIESWGKYSEQIEDYTRRGIQAKLSTPRGKLLSKIVDPFTYRNDIKVPVMIVNGANDRYWTVDAESKYWNQLSQPKWLLDVPNSGHGLEDRVRVISTVGAFARSMAGEFTMPRLDSSWRFDKKKSKLALKFVWNGIPYAKLRYWKVESDSKDFRPNTWVAVDPDKSGSITLDKSKNAAVIGEFTVKVDSLKYAFTVSTPVAVISKSRK